MSSPTLLILLGLCFCMAPLAAQDLHFSQFYHHTGHYSPAATGVFKGSVRVSGLYRAQWQSVPVAYKTYAVSAEWKALQHAKSQFSAAVLLQNDRAGDGNLSWTQGGLNFGAAHTLDASNTLSIGFGIAAIQRTVDLSHLTFKNQWASDFFDPTLPTKEQFGRSSGIASTLSAGMLWRYQSGSDRTAFTLGLGAFHLNRPVVSLGDFSAAKLPLRSALFAEGNYQIRETADLVVFAMAETQKSAKEVLIGAGIRQILTTGLANETAVKATLATRFGDAVIPALALERNNWLVGISYDWNISTYKEATRGRGGIEIAVIWRVVPVPVTKIVKCCPVF